MEPNRELISELELKHGRDINLLIDEKRPQINNSFSQISKTLSNDLIPGKEKLYFFENYILRNYLITIDSPFDSIREVSLNLLKQVSEISSKNGTFSLKTETQSAILLRILYRVNTFPFKEQSEEIRLQITRLLCDLIVSFKDGFYRNSGEAIQAVTCLLQDKFPEVKKAACLLLEKMEVDFSEQISTNASKILTQLCNNCFHSHSKIRKMSIESLARILVLPKIGENVKKTVEIISVLANDKSADIRESIFRCFGECLMGLSFEVLKENEIALVCELMGGCEDENIGISSYCNSLLQNFGDKRKEFFEKFES